MFPLLMIASRLSPILKSVSGSGLSLKGKTKETTTRASAEKQADEVETVVDKKGKEHAADSPTGKMIINMTKEEEAPDMFGGMELNKIKSALDEDSPLGMPEKVEGGVYKQIFEVNKMMLGSLQRIEGTLKLMLNLEYERALAFQQADVQQNLIEGDTDPVPDPDPEAGPGRFRRGLSAAGSMLGGAYSKVREFTPGTFTKLLGLGALIFAFNKYRDEIITAMASILEYFNDVYDVFKTEGLGSAFDKVVSDFANVFMPKVFSTVQDILGFIYDYIKESIFGASGSTKIRQVSRESITSRGNLATFSETDDTANMTYSDFGGLINTTTGQAIANDPIEDDLKNQLKNMRKISKESDGRIQWSTFPDRDFSQDATIPFISKGDGGFFTSFDVNKVINANPVIDGMPYENWEVLKTINLDMMAGISRSMSSDRADQIRDVLRRKTEAYQSGENVTEKLKVLEQEYQALDPVKIAEVGTSQFAFANYTNSTKSLNDMAITGTDRTSSSPSANFNPTTVVDNKKIIDAKEVHNHPMNADNINFTVRQLARYNNGEAVFGF